MHLDLFTNSIQSRSYAKLKMMDPGVRGLEFRGENVQTSSVNATNVENAVDDDPSVYIAKARKLAADPNTVPKLVGKTLLAGWLLAFFMKRLLRQFITSSDRTASRIVSTITLIAVILKIKAPKFVNPDLPNHVVLSLPIVGSLGTILLNFGNMHEFLLRTLTKAEFKTMEITLPGVHMLMLMDPRDREYILRGHFANYTKNLPGEMNSFDSAFSELFGRGIFAVDGAEWKDHRKIGKQSCEDIL